MFVCRLSPPSVGRIGGWMFALLVCPFDPQKASDVSKRKALMHGNVGMLMCSRKKIFSSLVLSKIAVWGRSGFMSLSAYGWGL